MISIELTGVEHLQSILTALGTDAPQALGAALYEEATEVLIASQEIVPYDTGNLRDTGMVTFPDVSANGEVEVIVGYGGPGVDYALAVHEDLSARHAEGKQAKYLEQPALEASVGMGERLADDITRRLG